VGVKPPGGSTRVETVDFDFTYGHAFGQAIHDAYERLLMDALFGDAALFTRDDEAEAEWALVTPILDAWKHTPAPRFPNYAAGTWGPEDAVLLLGQTGRHWCNRQL
jgi:glucose-6-phosphate 1-dehydrogenase